MPSMNCRYLTLQHGFRCVSGSSRRKRFILLGEAEKAEHEQQLLLPLAQFSERN